MSDDVFRPSISIQAEAAQQLAKEILECQKELDAVCSRWGMLSQKMLILVAAMQETMVEINGGVYPKPQVIRKFPELNHKDTYVSPNSETHHAQGRSPYPRPW
jgi:hypothetical protein